MTETSGWEIVEDDKAVRQTLYRFLVNKPNSIRDLVRELTPTERRKLLSVLMDSVARKKKDC